MKVLVLTVGDAEVASTKFRFTQFAASLAELGISLDFAFAGDRSGWPDPSVYDLVIVQKRLLRKSWLRDLRKRSRRLIFDTDDAIWEPHGRRHSWWTQVRTRHRLKSVAGLADACTVANRHLADELREFSPAVEVIPMALDEEVWHPAAERIPGPLRVGWAGAPPNLGYLTRLSAVLQDVQTARPEVRVEVYCGEKPVWNAPVAASHHPFSPGTEAEVMRTFDIGLLPLPDDAFAAGKSPIKGLQYAACGIPCVASPVGASCEIVKHGATGLHARTQEEWRDSLLRLIDDAALRSELGSNARRMFLENHTRRAVQGRMIDFWQRVVSGRS